jgi:5'-3' exonuclease
MKELSTKGDVLVKQADFLIMDGSSILVRAFFASAYGRRLLQSTQGVYTNAVFGFLNMMIGALERVRPRYAFVAWDVSRDTFRRELYSDYKGTRGELPDELHPQFTTTQNVLEAIGIPQHFDERYEADDIIGTLAHRASDEGHQVLILTGDRDALQLVRDNVTVAIMKRGITEVDLYTPDTLREQYGLTPAQWIDLKGLMGDTSDNIPGVPGIGEKTALKLLAEYSSVEHLLENCHTVKGKLRDKLEAHRDLALLSKKLATIVTDVPLSLTLEDCKLQLQLKRAAETLRELELQRFLVPLERLLQIG